MKNNGITEYFKEIELYEEYYGYFCSVADVITIVILGSICGLKNVKNSDLHTPPKNNVN